MWSNIILSNVLKMFLGKINFFGGGGSAGGDIGRSNAGALYHCATSPGFQICMYIYTYACTNTHVQYVCTYIHTETGLQSCS